MLLEVFPADNVFVEIALEARLDIGGYLVTLGTGSELSNSRHSSAITTEVLVQIVVTVYPDHK